MHRGTNRQILLAARPVGMIKESDFHRREVPIPVPQAGEFLVRNLYLSLDPTIRNWMNDVDSYMPAIRIGEVMRGGGIGVVVESRAPQYAVGDRVFGLIGWQDYALGRAADAMPMMVVPPGVPSTAALSVLGVTGVTAYFGVLDIGQPKAGETVVVSGAAGATGSVAGQIAKIVGCRVVGIAGSDAKCRWVTADLGFDACINYRTEDVGTGLRQTCPQGVDVYFDNVGGEMLDAVLQRINRRARVVLCGAISLYNAGELPAGPRHYVQLMVQRARMEGFIVTDYLPRFAEAAVQLGQWVAEGKLRYAVDVVDGLENATTAINRLFTGANTGKLIVKISDEKIGAESAAT
jgi:NADPH-dependent curcumin reductase CurA